MEADRGNKDNDQDDTGVSRQRSDCTMGRLFLKQETLRAPSTETGALKGGHASEENKEKIP